jgi:hypothetical protein
MFRQTTDDHTIRRISSRCLAQTWYWLVPFTLVPFIFLNP